MYGELRKKQQVKARRPSFSLRGNDVLSLERTIAAAKKLLLLLWKTRLIDLKIKLCRSLHLPAFVWLSSVRRLRFVQNVI